MHWQLAAGRFFQPLANLIAVHRPAAARKQSENDQRSRAGIQLLLELAILRFRVQFRLIPLGTY